VIVNSARIALSSIELGLSFDDISQVPLTLESSVSWLQLASIETFVNKPSEVTLSGRVIRWSADLVDLETYAIAVANHLKQFLLGECVPGFSRIQLSTINVSYTGNVEESDLEVLESYTLTLAFNLIGTLAE
jgi:hypothetical protein